MPGFLTPTDVHPLMRAALDAGSYGALPVNMLPAPQRTDAAYVGEGFQRYMSPERKASGFYGELGAPRGNLVSEYSLGGQAPAPFRQAPAGQAFTYPSLYPGMTGKQIGAVLADEAGGPRMPQSIEDQAFNSAQSRMAQGLSPFWNPQQDNLFRGMR